MTKPVQFINVSKKSIYRDENGQLLSHQKIIISVVSINQISQDTLLIGTELGLFYYLPAENQFIRFNAGDANDFIVTSILITADKTIWIGSFNGLIKAEKNKQVSRSIQPYHIQYPSAGPASVFQQPH